MRFISEYGYTVKLGQEEAYQQWLQAERARVRGEPPGGREVPRHLHDDLLE